MCRKWMGAARGVNAGWGGEALFLETETHPSHSDKWGGGGGRRGSYGSVCPGIRGSQGPISGSWPVTGPREA